jgi:S-formylglutathione hydrolase FrmB
MAIGTIKLESAALQTTTTYSLILPDPKKAGPGPYPVLLQLHGMYDDHSSWLDKSRLWSYVERLPLIVVMPSGVNSWWSNFGLDDLLGSKRPEISINYEDYLVNDLWDHINSTFLVRAGQRWAIGGLSMGGFGAVRLGLKYPDRFCSIYGHSSAFPPREELDQFLKLLPAQTLDDLDVYHWASRRTPSDLPALGFDCGLEDFLIDHNRAFHAHLVALGLPHTYLEYPGGHTWEYWDLHVREALAQHSRILGIEPLPVPSSEAFE